MIMEVDISFELEWHDGGGKKDVYIFKVLLGSQMISSVIIDNEEGGRWWLMGIFRNVSYGYSHSENFYLKHKSK